MILDINAEIVNLTEQEKAKICSQFIPFPTKMYLDNLVEMGKNRLQDFLERKEKGEVQGSLDGEALREVWAQDYARVMEQ